MRNTREDAITACQQCHIICQEALAYHGDEKGGTQLSSQHIKRMMATIELCQTTANMLIIRAPLVDQLCELTAHIVEQCSTSCAAIEMESMQRCADICRRCVKALYEESNHIKQVA